MTLKLHRASLFAGLALAATLSLLLGACGGGGGSDLPTTGPAQQAALTGPTAAGIGDSGMILAEGYASAIPAPTPDELLAQAMQATSTDDKPPTVAALSAMPEAATHSREPARASSSESPVDKTASSAARPRFTDGASAVSVASGATYYLDSTQGSDSNNGLAATGSAGAVGPWRSLAKLKSANLAAGDTVRLVCGSVWNETLVLASSGALGNPILVTSHPAGCPAKPLISGAANISAAQWTQHQGSIYRTTLTGAPTQLLSATATMTQAHHPNRGRDISDPASIYLRMAADADTPILYNRPVSTYMVTGTNLALPPGVGISAGTRVRIRSNAWTIEEKTISTVAGSKLTFTTPTAYPLKAGWGYFLVGQLWMLDEPGEWHYDAITKTLYAWMPDSRAPGAALATSRLAIGIDLESRRHITVDGVAIKAVGTGVNLKGSTSVVVRGSQVEDTNDHGVNAANSQDAVIELSSFLRIGLDAVTGQDNTLPTATGMRVDNNTMADIGVVMSGQSAASLPRPARAGIRPGIGATVTGNTITNTGSNGIWVLRNANVSNNVLYGTCTVVDDCGAIYTSGVNNNGTIRNNVVLGSRGAVSGKGPLDAYTQAQGVYLDESASGISVSGNTVTGADNGIQLHVAANNVIADNKLYGNRNNQLWLQETRNTDNPLGDVWGNNVTGNQIVPTNASARGIYQESNIADTRRFAAFDKNRYFDAIYPLVAEERTPTLRTQYTLKDWQGATASGVARNLDSNGSGVSQTRFASLLISGGSIVPNGHLATSTAGWTTWNATKPFGSLLREPCTAGWCARYVAGASPGILSSANFSLLAGTWYRLSFDAMASGDNQALSVVVRRGGGGANGYESLSDRSLGVTASRTWKRFSVVFKGSKTVNAADPLTKDLGARVDFQNIAPGKSISIANLELRPIVPAEALTRSEILINGSKGGIQTDCPTANSLPALCAIFVRLSDNAPVAWPHYLAPYSAEIIYTRDARLVDADGDGIPDGQDSCPATVAGLGVNGQGCAMSP